MKKFIVSNAWWITLVVALTMLVSHTLSFQPIKVDHTSVILLLVIFLSPFILAIKKIKIGDFEAEIDPNEVQRIRETVSKATDSTSSPQSPEVKVTAQDIKALAESDPILALARLRMELERSVNSLYRATHKGEQHSRRLSIAKIVHTLSNAEVLPKDIARSIREVVSICNRAMHGEEIRIQDAKSVVEAGSFLLYELSLYLNEYKYKPDQAVPIDKNTVEELMKGRYQVTTIVPLVNDPTKNIYIVDQEELDEFLEGYNECAEFIVEVKRLDGTERSN